MPNATCFLFAYCGVFLLELARFVGRIPWQQTWLVRSIALMTGLGFITHTIYLVDRIVIASTTNQSWRLLNSWHDWCILSAWALAAAYVVFLIRRSETRIGLFVLPLLLTFIGAAIALIGPEKNFDPTARASFWRLTHGIAMTLGTMLVTLGFAMAIMYFVQSWRLKAKLPSRGSFRLPSLEYLQSFGRLCLQWSAACIGFGVVSGVIMNLTQDGKVEWTDRGIVFSGGLFVWLVLAAIIQWQSSKRGRGELTAIVNILSFAIVIGVLALVVSAPHGTMQNAKPNTSNLPSPSLSNTFGSHA